eukprot:TRINITY_DN16680_c0_g1_i1.p1 TRINITY_DN16680_c0_g1~~TRINITY_DN16680_c0_g1_i1.p1  ORF type:complete len:294 (+),score=81.34 TRINITY_DN16680_c0_g1_i1:29-883(+)
MRAQTVKSKGPKQRTYQAWVEDGSVFLRLDLSGSFASDEYATSALANADTPLSSSSAGGASDLRSGQVLARRRPSADPPPLLQARCTRVIDETPTVRSFLFEVLGPPETLTYVAGQHAVFAVPADGGRLTRSWSFVSAPTPSATTFTIAVKRLPRGRASAWMHDHAAVGTRLDVLSIGGTFGFGSPQRPLSRATGGRILLLAAGIGVSPFVSMLRALFSPEASAPTPHGPRFDIHLFYSERTPPDFAFLKDLRRWAEDDSGGGGHRLRLHLTVTRPPRGWCGAG